MGATFISDIHSFDVLDIKAVYLSIARCLDAW